jgi:hypothetical protein
MDSAANICISLPHPHNLAAARGLGRLDFLSSREPHHNPFTTDASERTEWHLGWLEEQQALSPSSERYLRLLAQAKDAANLFKDQSSRWPYNNPSRTPESIDALLLKPPCLLSRELDIWTKAFFSHFPSSTSHKNIP